MLQSAWLGIGIVALCATAVALSTKTKGAVLFPNDDGIAIYSGVVGFIAWSFVAYGALDLQVVGDSTVHSFSMPSVTIFAVMMAVVPGFIALTGPVDIVRRARDNADLGDV